MNITGLHIHEAAKGVIGPIRVDSGLAAFTDTDGKGNVTTRWWRALPATLQAILDNPRSYYVNLHTSANHPGGRSAPADAQPEEGLDLANS